MYEFWTCLCKICFETYVIDYGCAHLSLCMNSELPHAISLHNIVDMAKHILKYYAIA